MSLLDSCIAIIEPGYRAAQARIPFDVDVNVPVLSGKCACGRRAQGKYGVCKSCSLAKAMKTQTSARRRFKVAALTQCMCCSRPAARGDVVCGRRLCREVV